MLQYEENTDSWKEIGRMAKLRGFHAIGAFRPTSVKSGKSVQNHHCRHVSFSSSLSSAHPNANQRKRAKYSQMS